MDGLKRVQHQYKVTGADFCKIKVTGTKKENHLMMTLVSIGLASTILTPLLSIL
ncbi:hypothetical protein [Xenorhabdus bovienii]|uniref:hypothetical protein n=1 Tax=Xenorhabdus bovienii TaxID=40576 RepID=UPI00237CF55F|nr:hypothetical protein [Xenorhabdus bovienii]MDE1493367.1 hypothetical protein [Xenorhabdus bovienii]